MKFDDAVRAISTKTDLRRVASAHVVDHRQLEDDELRQALLKVRPQYTHKETVWKELENALWRSSENDDRVLARLLIGDVLLEEFGFLLPYSETEEKVLDFERAIIDASNETDILELACGNKESQRHQQIELYYFVLGVAWEHQETKSPDESNLLRKLRAKLKINEWDHRLLEAKLGKYPKPGNELHSRAEIDQIRRKLQSAGLLFPTRTEEGVNVDVIPEEIAVVVRSYFGMELRVESYRELLTYPKVRRKPHFVEILEKAGIEYSRYDTLEKLSERVIRNVKPSQAIASSSPRFGLSNDQLKSWCQQLGLVSSGTMEDRVSRIIKHYDELRPRAGAEGDERAVFYEFYEALAKRDRDTLRKQHLIEKDIEIEAKFEEATRYLFDSKLNHTPLKQSGSNHPDGLISLGTNYLMWDNKSKDSPGVVNLKEHLAQFDGYMKNSDKPVPIFLVIGPDFTEESEVEAIRYHAQNFSRNILLITANELKALAEEWSAPRNPKRDEPFPLALLAFTGRFDRRKLGDLT